MTENKFIDKLINNVSNSSVDINGKVVLASDILITNDYSIKDQIAAYQQLVDKFGGASNEVNALNAAIKGLDDIINTFAGNDNVIT